MATNTTPSDGTAQTNGSFTRYDLLLLAMPVPLIAGWAGAHAADAPVVGGMGVGSILSAALLAYGLFVDTPTE